MRTKSGMTEEQRNSCERFADIGPTQKRDAEAEAQDQATAPRCVGFSSPFPSVPERAARDSARLGQFRRLAAPLFLHATLSEDAHCVIRHDRNANLTFKKSDRMLIISLQNDQHSSCILVELQRIAKDSARLTAQLCPLPCGAAPVQLSSLRLPSQYAFVRDA